MAKKFFDDPDIQEEEVPENVAPYPLLLRIIGYTIKYTFWAAIAAVFVLLAWRLFFSTGFPKEMKTLFADAELRDAYAAYLADTSEEKEPFAICQDYFLEHNMTVESEDEETGQKDNYGYFGIVDHTVFPTAGQVQFIFRYNLSTLDHLNEDYNLGFTPEKEEDWYVVRLRVAVYDDPANKNAERVTETVLDTDTVDSAAKSVYCYRQMCVSGLPEISSIKAIYVDIYYKNDVDTAILPYGSVQIFDDDAPDSEYKLDKKDIKSLKGEE